MSDTPRTDEIVRECGGVTSAWARKLETELTSARSELAHAQSNLTIRRRLCDEIQSELGVALLAGDESLTAGLAAIKGLKAELEKAKAVRNDSDRRRSKAEAENRELKSQLTALQKAVGRAKESISDILRRVVQKDDRYEYEGFRRWGLIEKDIHTVIDNALTPAPQKENDHV